MTLISESSVPHRRALSDTTHTVYAEWWFREAEIEIRSKQRPLPSCSLVSATYEDGVQMPELHCIIMTHFTYYISFSRSVCLCHSVCLSVCLSVFLSNIYVMCVYIYGPVLFVEMRGVYTVSEMSYTLRRVTFYCTVRFLLMRDIQTQLETNSSTQSTWGTMVFKSILQFQCHHLGTRMAEQGEMTVSLSYPSVHLHRRTARIIVVTL